MGARFIAVVTDRPAIEDVAALEAEVAAAERPALPALLDEN
jgi:hypothetical protein